MKKLGVLLLVSLMATSAVAGLDDGDNSIGFFFDTFGNTNEYAVGASVPFFGYIVVSNPTFPELSGYEASYDVVTPPGLEGMFFRLNEDLQGGLNVAVGNTATAGEYVVGWPSPRTTTQTTILTTWQMMLLTPMTVEIFLGPTNVQSIDDGLPALEVGGSIVPAGLSTGGAETPVAVINGTGPVAEESSSFGGVKALFR